jgi:1-acyl-sn-glycerol-3-phosphate acyltransferase
LILARFFVRSYLIKLFARNPIKRRWLEIKNTTKTSKRFLQAFNVKLKVKNPERLQELKDKNYLVVGNHASFLDIFVLGAVENYVFITSTDMSEAPVVGDIIRKGGCLYTNRKKKFNLPDEITRFAETVRAGFKVVLFPEQSGTDGSHVKEFRRSLFQVAVDAACTVVPVCIRYLRLDGKPVDEKNRNVICWYKGVNFLKYYWNLMAHRLEAELCFLDPVEYDPNRNRSELSDLVYEKVRDTFHSYDAQPV